MKKSLLVLFAFVLFEFNGSAQCNGGIIIPQTSSVCAGLPIMISNGVLPGNVSSNVSYQWLMNGTPMPGQTQAMQFVLSGYTMGVFNFQRRVTDLTNSCIAYSNTVTINTFPAFFQGVIGGNDTICTGLVSSTINSYTMPIGGDGTYYYQWQKSENNGGTWSNISGATNTTYAPGILTTTTQYRRSDGSTVCGYSLNGNQITKTVMACGVFSSNITGPTTIAPNQTATYSITPIDGMKYLWAVTSGTITSGQGTYTITIMWDGGASANARTTAADYSVSVTETDATPESRTTTQPITATTTAINKGFGSTGISIFPNPLKSQFIIEMPTANTAVNYTVYTTTGVQVQSGSFNAVSSGNTIATQLPVGMYQLVLNYDGVFTSTRLAVVNNE